MSILLSKKGFLHLTWIFVQNILVLKYPILKHPEKQTKKPQSCKCPSENQPEYQKNNQQTVGFIQKLRSFLRNFVVVFCLQHPIFKNTYST